VALGTICDIVPLLDENRFLAKEGLRLLPYTKKQGLRALLEKSRLTGRELSSYDVGFIIGPRLNAAGRLEDMSLGITALLSKAPAEAIQLAARLDALNRERRSIEADMQDSALTALEETDPAGQFSLALFDETWHQGVIGILASRLKDRFHRPVIAFARANDDELKGSGRSIAGLHLRDALDLVAKRHPGLIRKFGGHAAAAGLSIAECDLGKFAGAFEQVASELLTEADLKHRIETDGSLPVHEISLELAQLLENEVWGQGFPAPSFNDIFTVEQQRIVGQKHLKLRLKRGGKTHEAILFHRAEPLPAQIHAAYSLGVNEYNGNTSVQLIVRHWSAAEN